MPMNKTDKFLSNNNYYISATCKDAVLAPVSSNTVDMGNVITLNETSLFIIRAMEEGLSIDQIVSKMMNEYDAPSRTAVECDVMRIAQSVVNKGFFSVIN